MPVLNGAAFIEKKTDGQFYIEAIQDVNKNYLKVMHSLLFTKQHGFVLK
jgi:hypothetical protein